MIDPEAQALGFNSRIESINGLEFHIVEAGDGPSILFLHGFPEYWGTWQTVMAALQSEFRCIAPDLRGYGRSAKPQNQSAYSIDHLVSDGLGLLDLAGPGVHVLVGHDWGATLAFHLAMKSPERIGRLIILNGAHPYILQDHIWDNPDQRRASQYMAALMADEADHGLRAENARTIAHDWLGISLAEDRLTQAHYHRFIELWSDPETWRSMINWYRASRFDVPGPDAAAPKHRWTSGLDYHVACPVTMIWGNLDPVFSWAMLRDISQVTRKFDLYELPAAGHVPHRDEAEKCIKIIRQHARRAFDRTY